jgi:hypothetical protein
MTAGGFGEPTGPQDQPQFGQGPFSEAPADQTQPVQAPFTGAAQDPPQYDQQAQYSQPQYGSAPTYGQPQYNQTMPYGRTGRGTNALAITSLCCAIGQIILGPLAGIPAVITGAMSLGQIARSGEDGRGMAITGLVLGIIGLILTVLFIILFVAVWNRVSSS